MVTRKWTPNHLQESLLLIRTSILSNLVRNCMCTFKMLWCTICTCIQCLDPFMHTRERVWSKFNEVLGCFYLMLTKISTPAGWRMIVWSFWLDPFFLWSKQAVVWETSVFHVSLIVPYMVFYVYYVHNIFIQTYVLCTCMYTCMHSLSDDDPSQTSSFVHWWLGRPWWWSLGVFSPTMGHL